jgi:hypothetical protein
MERDEAGTFERLKQLRKELIEPVLEQYGGRFVDLKGDGVIVEFGSVISAVEAAVEIQRAMQAQDPDLPEGLPSDWGCGGGQGMTGRVFGWLGIKDGVGFAPGGNRDRGIGPKRRRDGDRPPR